MDTTFAGDARLNGILRKVIGRIEDQRRVPAATYRLQFHAGFTFRDACQVVSYLDRLGITESYASPYLKARAGSLHGYDISDHGRLNPEIGSDEDYAAWVQTLHDHRMGQILDIVPNHMGIVGNENVWWNDVLENGPCARHAGFFDIDWMPLKPELHGKIMICILGDNYGKALESGQVSLAYEAGGFTIRYFDHRFPVAPETSLLCLRFRSDELETLLNTASPDLMEFQSILTALEHLPGRSETDPRKVDERYREKEVIRRRLAALTESSGAIREFIEQNVTRFNGTPGDRHSFDLLDHLLRDQAYRLAYWQVAADEINYRRFFNVNELAALNMEKPEVFAATHGLILRLFGEGAVTGLRVDHPDGLFDPRKYFEDLQHHAVLAQVRHMQARGELELSDSDLSQLQTELRRLQSDAAGPLWRPAYVLAEKILGADERIPDDWRVHGTTGYEFVNRVNGLFVARDNEAAFSRIYESFTGMSASFRPYIHDKKFLILQVALSGELHVLAHQLDRLSEKQRWSRDFTLNSLRHALREIIACFPVYRSYITDTVLERDRCFINIAVVQAKRRNPALSRSIFDFVRDMLLLQYADSTQEADRDAQRRFVGKFQQVTAPVMAKGLEDTSFYVYNRLVSLNEVGGDPGRFGQAAEDVHRFLQDRQQHWPDAMSASSTHDTKRSEDVRARLNVLSEMPDEWQTATARWHALNELHRTQVDNLDAPDGNDEYLVYQTLLGAWPLDAADQPTFVERIRAYMSKALHEAQVHSSWTNQNAAYDEAVGNFIGNILDEDKSGPFLEDFRLFQTQINHFGLFNALAQTLVKITAPGVPDFYQGTELWDFSLVDPDNRRPVDYRRREEMLADLSRHAAAPARLAAFARELVDTKNDGRIKLYLIWRALQARRAQPELFARGEYEPIVAAGSHADHVFAFARRTESALVIVAVPRLLTTLLSRQPQVPLGPEVWQDTALVLPNLTGGVRFRNAFTNEIVGHELPLAELFANFPVALLHKETTP